uniref:Uncharacterized protein n=1 Tax=Romanomermis culicivorax TaxID=13658 RepID=A0A915HUY4_ROMCU
MQNFHTYNDERPKHAELYKNYIEDYGYSKCQTCNCIMSKKKKKLDDKKEENERRNRQTLKT